MKKLLNGDSLTVFLVMGLSTMAMAVLNPVMTLYLTSIGVVPSLIGLMLSVGMVGMVFGEPSGGWLADKVGLKTPMLIGTFLCAPLVFCFVFAVGPFALFAVFFGWGIVRSSVFGPSRGFIGSTTAPRNKATIMALYMTFLTLSRSLGSLISGYVADSSWGYDGDFYVSVVLSLLAGLLVVIGLRKKPMWLSASAAASSVGNISPMPVRQPVSYRPVIIQSIVGMLFFMSIGINSFLPLLATEFAGVSASQVGLLYTAGGIVSVILLIPLGKLADRRNKKTAMIIGMLFSAAGLAGLAFAREYSLMMVLVIVNNIGFAMFTPAAVALLSNNVPSHWQSTAMGVYGAAEDVGIIFGSGVGGFVWTAGGPMALYMMGSLAGVLGAFICLGFVKELVTGRGSTLETTSI